MNSLTWKTLAIFWQHAKKYPWHIFLIVLAVVWHTVIQAYVPLLYRNLLDTLSGGISEEAVAAGVRIVFMILFVSLLRTTLWRVGLFTSSYFRPKVMADLTNSCYDYLQRHSYGFFTSKFVGSLVTKAKRFERSFETIADQVSFQMGRSFLDISMITAVLLWQYPLFGLIVLAWCAIFLTLSIIFSLYKLPYDVRRADADTETTAQLADSITNNVNIKIFTSLFREKKRFAAVTDKQFWLRKASYDIGVMTNMFQSLMTIGLEFAVMYLAIVHWRQGILTIGAIVLFQAYILRLTEKIWDIGENINKVYEALADANEMTEMLVAPHEVQDALGARQLKVRRGHIEFKDIAFSYYKETPVLKKLNLDIASGERLALIGPSGGGKSTIIKLLFRFHDVESGAILIDGQDISKATQDSLRAGMALVPQDPILFHRSLMDNIRYARPKATNKEVIRAARLAHAEEFIANFRDGYNTLVGERGIKLSGGERQRVAIARAILKDAPILVLDEATSSLDSESEMYIQDALKKLMQNRTTIVVAHRLSTIMQMDRIVVISAGKIIEEGKHKELLKVKQGVYQKLWDIQAGGFAPAKTAS